MTTVILRPDATLQAGTSTSFTGATCHGSVADANDGTGVTPGGGGTHSPGGNGVPAANLPVVSFANATGNVPVGSTINSVQINFRGRNWWSAGGVGYGEASIRYSDNIEAVAYDTGRYPYPGSANAIYGYSDTLATATRYDAGATKGAWTFALVDGLKAVIGSDYGASENPNEVVDVWLVVTYTLPPAAPAPTAITPAAASTVVVPNPVLGATLTAASGQTQRAEWQLATGAGFTANVKTVTESTGDLRVSGATTESPTTAALNLNINGTWYIRARSLDVYGQYGAYSAGQSFTVTVPPPPVPTVLTPAAAATVTTMTPTLGGTVGAASSGRLSHLEWQLATDAGFTANVRTITEATIDNRVSGVTTEVVPTGSKLTINGTWYMRARAIADDLTASAYTASQTFTLLLGTPPVPTLVTPVDLSTVTTNTPVLGVTLGAAPEGRTSKSEWQLATNIGFTTGLRTVTESDTDLRVSGATTEVVSGGSALTQTLWYMRARSVDQYGYVSAYTAITSFTVAHQPNTTGQSPTATATIVYAATNTFQWTFTDPSPADSQRAYQVIIERNDTGALILDTGKVISTAVFANLACGAGNKDTVLRWKIQVWDQDDISSGYSGYQLFTVTDPPTVTITYPADAGTAGSGRPTVTWTNDVATVQAKYQVVIKLGAVIVHDSGLLTGAALSYTPAAPVLSNGLAYTVIVTVTDNVNLIGTDTNAFTATYVAPANVVYTVNVNTYPTVGYVLIDWSQMQADVYFSKWRVYRKELNDIAWTMLLETADVNRVTYKDWKSLSGYSYQYAVTQVGDRSGVLLESSIDSLATLYPLSSGAYWLLNPNDDTKNFQLFNVTSDSYTNEIEQESFTVINRGRKTNYGTSLGKVGTLAAQLRDKVSVTARQQKVLLEAMQQARATYLLRDPFGNVLQVSMGNVQVDRVAGVGNSEFVNVSVPYSEVF